MKIENQQEGQLSKEEPLYVIQDNKETTELLVFMMVLISCFCWFAVLLPVIKTGRIESILFYNPITAYKFKILFLGSIFVLLGMPFGIVSLLKKGEYRFYNNRMEKIHYISKIFQRKIIYYNEMHLILKDTVKGEKAIFFLNNKKANFFNLIRINFFCYNEKILILYNKKDFYNKNKLHSSSIEMQYGDVEYVINNSADIVSFLKNECSFICWIVNIFLSIILI